MSTVDGFEVAEDQRELAHLRWGELAVGAVEGVGDRVGEILGGEVGLEVEDVFAERLDVAVLRLVVSPHVHVHARAHKSPLSVNPLEGGAPCPMSPTRTTREP